MKHTPAADVVESLRYSRPQLRLARHVTLLFAWSDLQARFDGWMPAVDGQVLIRIAGSARLETLDGTRIALPPCAVVGPLSTTVRMVASPGYRAIGAGLTPTGLRQLFRVPASELTDASADLRDFCGNARLESLVDRAGDLTRPHLAWQAMEDLLLEVQSRRAPSDDPRAEIVDDWMRGSVNPNVDALSERLGTSARHAARLTAASHGLSPKILAMRWRAQRAAAHFALADPGERSLAYLGFSDQSHMIREFRRFIGTTPSRLLDDDDIHRHTLAGPNDVGARLF